MTNVVWFLHHRRRSAPAIAPVNLEGTIVHRASRLLETMAVDLDCASENLLRKVETFSNDGILPADHPGEDT